MRAAIVGAGSWGTALAVVLADAGHEVRLWSYEPEVAEELALRHRNPRYLPGVELARTIFATVDLAEALAGAELVVLVSPSHVTREMARKVAPLLPEQVPIVCATKGLESGTSMTMSEVLEEVLEPSRHPYLAFLSGPSFAAEVARKMPTAVVVASRWERIGRAAQQALGVPWFRVYTSSDVAGVELGGALKNVVAIAVGASDGMGHGANARSALITRGLAEMTRLATRRGANPMTLSGLAGLGDLVLTCTGELSRNRQVGLRLGRGERIDEILASMVQVAEGVRTAESAHELARGLDVDMPITDAVHGALFQGLTAREAMLRLLAREPKAELG